MSILSRMDRAFSYANGKLSERYNASREIESSSSEVDKQQGLALIKYPCDFFSNLFGGPSSGKKARSLDGCPHVGNDVYMSILLGGLPEDMTGHFGGLYQPPKKK
jgi:hypothetical protein